MTESRVHTLISRAKRYDIIFRTDASTSNGWKISIQGKRVEDIVYLYSRLRDYLDDNNVPFKIATKKRLDIKGEQGNKAMTIYCPNGTRIKDLAQDVYRLIKDYKGWWDVKTPHGYDHYAGGLFIRNDRDEYGNYIPAKDV